MSSNPFHAFYDTGVNICSVKSGSGYSDRSVKKEKQLAALTVDLQPYNGGLAEKQYGLTAECQYRMFSDTCEHVKERSRYHMNRNICMMTILTR